MHAFITCGLYRASTQARLQSSYLCRPFGLASGLLVPLQQAKGEVDLVGQIELQEPR